MVFGWHSPWSSRWSVSVIIQFSLPLILFSVVPAVFRIPTVNIEKRLIITLFNSLYLPSMDTNALSEERCEDLYFASRSVQVAHSHPTVFLGSQRCHLRIRLSCSLNPHHFASLCRALCDPLRNPCSWS